MSIDEKTLLEERKVLEQDFNTTKDRIVQVEKDLGNMKSNLNAVYGAIQQIDKLLAKVMKQFNAELGFVSGSQVINIDPDLYWTIPLDLYSPIQQDAVLLHKGLDKKAAREFLEFLNSDPARKIIQSFGYDLE